MPISIDVSVLPVLTWIYYVQVRPHHSKHNCLNATSDSNSWLYLSVDDGDILDIDERLPQSCPGPRSWLVDDEQPLCGELLDSSRREPKPRGDKRAQPLEVPDHRPPTPVFQTSTAIYLLKLVSHRVARHRTTLLLGL